MSKTYASEADLVRCFVAQLHPRGGDKKWTVYPETADWDLLLIHRDGYQLGLEAKLTLNAKAIDQALEGQHKYWARSGPDYRGVLVPQDGLQLHLVRICAAIGVGILSIKPPLRGHSFSVLCLPSEDSYSQEWPHWMPAQRCAVPAYIPDVEAGHKSPVKLTDWKIKAIKLMIVLERRGWVTRRDMSALQISASRFTDLHHGFLAKGPNGYVRSDRTPDLRAQHPVNYAQIEADTETWAKLAGIDLQGDSGFFI
jgi:hypothetical protein